MEITKSLIASEIVKMRDDLTINTVQAVLKKLLKKDLIKVDEIVYSGTVLSRSYIPSISLFNFEIQKFFESIHNIPEEKITTSNFVATLLEMETNTDKVLYEIEELEKMLKEKKELLNQTDSKK